jgi:hypothetical protein
MLDVSQQNRAGLQYYRNQATDFYGWQIPWFITAGNGIVSTNQQFLEWVGRSWWLWFRQFSQPQLDEILTS